jgi:hypothetical protein
MSSAATRTPAGGAVTLFEVPFASAMSDRDVALLVSVLELSTHLHPQTLPNDRTRGVARLDHSSGLFLTRSSTAEWLLAARTWGHPTPQSVHEWHVLAAGAAHQLDPTVTLPERSIATLPAIPDHPVGRAANKRFSRIRRHLAGL